MEQKEHRCGDAPVGGGRVLLTGEGGEVFVDHRVEFIKAVAKTTVPSLLAVPADICTQTKWASGSSGA